MLDGIRRMYYEEEDIFYYITLMNENYEMPILPLGSTEGICRGIYQLSQRDAGRESRRTCSCSAAARFSASRCGRRTCWNRSSASRSSVYSVTSYKTLYYDGRDCDRWNRLHPDSTPRRPYVTQVLSGDSGPIVAASDYVAAVPLSIAPWVGPDYTVLGTDGFGRSEAREDLRRFFEVDAENIALAALEQLVRKDAYPKEKLAEAVVTLGLDPEKLNQVRL